MSTRRRPPKVRPTSRRTIKDFEDAVKDRAVASGVQVELADERLFSARFAIYELVQELEAAVEAAIEATLKSSGRCWKI